MSEETTYNAKTLEKLATIRKSESGKSTLELRVTTCYESAPKLDLRTWYKRDKEPGCEYAGKGLRFTTSEAAKLRDALTAYLKDTEL